MKSEAISYAAWNSGQAVDIVLFDPPTFPKGVLSLSLINVASSLSRDFIVEIADLNFTDPTEYLNSRNFNGVMVFGLKVSGQNFNYAKDISAKLKQRYPRARILWGGELPTLLAEECKEHADTIVCGLFEPVADEFMHDLANGGLKEEYRGDNNFDLSNIPSPRFDLLSSPEAYYSFMGLPLETSRGCTEKCAFCMVHVMQKKNYYLRGEDNLKAILENYKGHFVNIVDYNFGVDKHHVMKVSSLLAGAGANGWMAEMCIEELDDDELLEAMSNAGCRMIYCGLESIDDKALASVHKMNTNHVDRYEKIIRKAQKHGIQIAAGIIIGLENMDENTFTNLEKFFNRMGLIYAKLTFLTYNPGTKVQTYMKKKGEFITDDVTKYDGNHLTYVPFGLDVTSVLSGAEQFIKRFYSGPAIIKRSFNTNLLFWRRVEFILFNFCYRQAYFKWLDENVLHDGSGIDRLMEQPFKKGTRLSILERLLFFSRKFGASQY
jgi:radical SAM superfamily enzyme YgiQ (UPF0313 family)